MTHRHKDSGGTVVVLAKTMSHQGYCSLEIPGQ